MPTFIINSTDEASDGYVYIDLTVSFTDKDGALHNFDQTVVSNQTGDALTVQLQQYTNDYAAQFDRGIS